MRPILLFFFLLSFNFLFGQEKWTLEQCIEQAVANNLDVALQDINAELAELGLKQSKNAFGPNINGSFNMTESFGRSLDFTTYEFINQSAFTNRYSFNYSQDMFSGMTKLNALKKSKLAVESALLTKTITEENIQLQLLSSFLSVLMAKEQLSQAIKQKENTQQERDRTQDLIDDGFLAPNDIYLLDAQLASDDIAITTFKNNIALGLSELKIIMRLSPTSDIDVTAPSVDDISMINANLESIDEVYNVALQHRSEIKSAEVNEALGEYDLKIAKGRYYPTVTFDHNTFTNYSSQFILPFSNDKQPYFTQFKDNLSYSLGLTLNIPIFNKNITRLGVQQANVSMHQNRLMTEKAKTELYRNVTRAHSNAVAAIENFNAAVANESAAKKSLESAQSKLADGLGSNVEFNVASNNYAIATSRLIEAKYNYIFNIKYLEFYKGIPIQL